MANGHIEIHDPFTSPPNLKRSEDADAASDSEDMDDDTVEFRLLMAYAKRRRGDRGSPRKNGTGTLSPPGPPARTEQIEDEKTTTKKKKKKKKKRGWKQLRRFLGCIKPQTREHEPEHEPEQASDRHYGSIKCLAADEPEEEEEEDLDEAAKCLTKIADDIPFVPPGLETDSPNDDVERLIGLLLRETGDRLNEKELKDLSVAKELFWNYSFFEKIISTLLTRMGFRTSDPDSLGPHASPKAQIAVTCEATSRLSALDTLPMNRLLGYGSRYLNKYYASWAREQGGYEAAFESDEEEEEEEEEKEKDTQ